MGALQEWEQEAGAPVLSHFIEAIKLHFLSHLQYRSNSNSQHSVQHRSTLSSSNNQLDKDRGHHNLGRHKLVHLLDSSLLVRRHHLALHWTPADPSLTIRWQTNLSGELAV
jgi:hypothetical protein